MLFPYFLIIVVITVMGLVLFSARHQAGTGWSVSVWKVNTVEQMETDYISRSSRVCRIGKHFLFAS